MKGQLFPANAREVEFTCDRRTGKAGEFRCGGKSFPLAQGALFLIDLRGGKTVIEQVPVAGSHFPPGALREQLDAMAKTNEKLARILRTSEME